MEGDEVCDDGINDGSYGGCLEDCSALGEHCGDGIINGPEACDDGDNDNGYGGCAADCLTLGPRCGDGIVQESAGEACDNGNANENGSGCNVDCTSSGMMLDDWWSPPVTQDCVNGATTNPLFRENGNILVAATGGCSGSTTWLYELTPDLETVTATETQLTIRPRRAVMRGNEWLMSGGNTCNYTVDPGGTLTEVCEESRIAGRYGLRATDNGTYIAANDDTFALYSASSPTPGDSPTWTYIGPEGYSFRAAVIGANDSAVVAGSYFNGTNILGAVRRFTSNGAPAGVATYTEFGRISHLQMTQDGGFVGTAFTIGGDGYRVFAINQTLSLEWSKQIDPQNPSSALYDLVLDSSGDLIVERRGENTLEDRILVKLAPNGDVRWSHYIEFEQYPSEPAYAVDASDRIVRAAVEHNPLVPETRLRVTRFAP